MKLRNKKTGEIGEVAGVMRFTVYKPNMPLCENSVLGQYDTLAELSEEWEDYKPAEPLIKDEKVRKAVRAWAEANGIGGCICKIEIHCITFETERGMFISFEDVDSIPSEGNYTIAELCRDEE